MQRNHEELQLIAVKEFDEYNDMYKVVDFLNKNLKSTGLIFGLTLRDGKNVITIYDANGK
jgi:hypothetical protein